MTRSYLLNSYVQARNYRRGRAGGQILWIVLHSMEAPETVRRAEETAAYFASLGAPDSSVHACADLDSLVGCVEEEDTAYGAPGANDAGLHIEHAGYAGQTRAQWLDPYGIGMLRLSSRLAADWSVRHNIPPEFRTAADLEARRPGVTTHEEVKTAFGGDHWDPGPEFPMDEYLRMMRAWINPAPPIPLPPKITMEEEMPNGACTVTVPDGGKPVEHIYSVNGPTGEIEHSWTSEADWVPHRERFRLDQCPGWPLGAIVTDASPMFGLSDAFLVGFTIRTANTQRHVQVFFVGSAVSPKTGYQARQI